MASSPTPKDRPTIDVVLPVHNEAESISATLREFHQKVTARNPVGIRFVVCEDGSSDDSVAVVQRLAGELPLHLITSSERKGYSRAVIDGFRASASDIVGFIDSDGQCDPEDFSKLWAEIQSCDLVIGYRNPRSDPWVRLAMSRAFRAVYGMLFPVPVRDPSCPYLLVRQPTLQAILTGNVGILKQGFWWEFVARAVSLGVRIREVPIHHRARLSGQTRVYSVGKVPRIAFEHIRGLFALRKELTKGRT